MISSLTNIFFKLLGFLKAKTGGSLKTLSSGVFCMVVYCSRTILEKNTERRMVCNGQWHSVIRVLCFILDEFFSINTTFVDKTMITVSMTFQFPKNW